MDEEGSMNRNSFFNSFLFQAVQSRGGSWNLYPQQSAQFVTKTNFIIANSEIYLTSVLEKLWYKKGRKETPAGTVKPLFYIFLPEFFLSLAERPPLMVSLSLQTSVLVSLVTYVYASKAVMSLCCLRPAKNATWPGSFWKDAMGGKTSQRKFHSPLKWWTAKCRTESLTVPAGPRREYISVVMPCLEHHSCFVKKKKKKVRDPLGILYLETAALSSLSQTAHMGGGGRGGGG